MKKSEKETKIKVDKKNKTKKKSGKNFFSLIHHIFLIHTYFIWLFIKISWAQTIYVIEIIVLYKLAEILANPPKNWRNLQCSLFYAEFYEEFNGASF